MDQSKQGRKFIGEGKEGTREKGEGISAYEKREDERTREEGKGRKTKMREGKDGTQA